MRSRLTALIAVVALVVQLVACSESREDPSASPVDTPAQATHAPTASASPTTSAAMPSGTQTASGPSTEITLDLGRGIERPGRHYGAGEIGVVLSHMGRPGDSQEDWAAFAEELVDAGYQVVTFDHDAQAVWRQVLTAVEHLRGQGAKTVVVVGASYGAMASLRAAQEPGNSLAGVVWLAGVQVGSGYAFEEEDVAAVGCPILFLSGTEDEYGAAEDAELLSAWAANGDLLLVDSALHGTDILLENGRAGDALRGAILDFIEEVTSSPVAECG